MLEVHPPHESAHSWKDVFIHIGIIVVGLLIALGLEQTVEFFHHRREARHARELIASEMADNNRLQEEEQRILGGHENFLFDDLAVIDRLRHHALRAGDRMVLFRPGKYFNDSAWLTVQQSGAIALFSYAEIQRYARLYHIQGDFNEAQEESTTALQMANTMFYRGAADRYDDKFSHSREDFAGAGGPAAARLAFEDHVPDAEKLNRLTPAEIDRLEQAVQEAIFEDEHLINRCKWLADGYREFGQ